MCPGHNHRTRLANVTEAHFNQTIVGYLRLPRSLVLEKKLEVLLRYFAL